MGLRQVGPATIFGARGSLNVDGGEIFAYQGSLYLTLWPGHGE